MRVLDAEQMRRVDRAAIDGLGVPSMVLMENAAIGVVDAIGERFSEARRVAIFCGPGNNGGDGMAVARHLAARGYECRLFAVGPAPAASSDAASQRDIVARLGLEIGRIETEAAVPAALAQSRDCDLVVDALFGTGLSRPLAQPFGALVDGLSRLGVSRLAVDVPSGLDASRSEPIGPHFIADLTVTFAAPKVALVLAPASAAAGEVVVTDLGVPRDLVEESGARLHLLVAEELAGYLTPRPREGHKGDFGHLLIVAGSPGKSGAAILAARAAVRAGAGLVTAAVPREILATVDLGSVESMTVALPDAGPEGLDGGAAAAVFAAGGGKTAVALGPGLGTEAGTRAAIIEMVMGLDLPLVLDADGLNAFAGAIGRLRERRAPTLLTPHPGEMARLLGSSSADVNRDRVESARRAAAASGAIVILKGHETLVAEPDGEVWINPTGNPGMATGGSGDVLTGLLGSLLAQGFEPLAAAQLGVYVHGLAGDRVAAETGERGLRAGDLVSALPGALRALAEA
jgi:NAD(P)H-hydrate epimerase